jgi:hypothetical protein
MNVYWFVFVSRSSLALVFDELNHLQSDDERHCLSKIKQVLSTGVSPIESTTGLVAVNRLAMRDNNQWW